MRASGKGCVKVLLVRLDHMGDIVLTVPPIASSLRAAYPDADIEVLTTAAGEQLLRDDSSIDRLTVFDPPWSVPRAGSKIAYIGRCLKFLVTRLRRVGCRYDVILFLSFSPWERFLVGWQGKLPAGFSGPYRRPVFRLSSGLLSHSTSFDSSRHALENGFDLLQSVFPRAARLPSVSLAVSEERVARGRESLMKVVIGDGRPVVMFHAGTDASMKAWPFLRYLAVAESLSKEFDANCVFVGTPSEVRYYERECLRANRRPPRMYTTTSVDLLVSFAANADVFVANDGGPMHIAAALGIPTVAVFGPTDERVFGPKGQFCRVVREPGICGRRQYPWQVDACCRHRDKECLHGIQVPTVLSAVRVMLRESDERRLSRASLG